MVSPSKKLLKKKFDFGIRSIAIQGMNNIKTELMKRGQEADVSYIIYKNKIDFIVQPKIEKIEEQDIPEKDRKILNVLKNVPIELLNEEMSKEQFSTVGIDKAMERTQEQTGKRIQDAIRKLI
jgi:hypothetical protein